MTFIPAYQNLGYGYYDEYLDSDEWKGTKERILKKYPKSRYCWICDTKRAINLHHENYWAMPKEQFMTDVVYLCQPCHSRVHRLSNGAKTVLEKRPLQKRREELRREYIRTNLRPSTYGHFFLRWLYRLFW